MTTEITDNNSGLILYDGQCGFCRGWVARGYRLLRSKGFRLASFHEPWVRERHNFESATGPAEMCLVKRDGTVLGGADALLEIARVYWWARPLVWGARFPGARPALRAGYRWVARHRHQLGGACAVPGRSQTHLPEQSRTSGFFELP